MTTDGGYMSTGSYLTRREIYQSQHVENDVMDNAGFPRQLRDEDEIGHSCVAEKHPSYEVTAKLQTDQKNA
jgi:hypothetical protein